MNVLGLSLQRVGEETFPAASRVELAGRGSAFVYRHPGPAASPAAPTLVLLHGLWATGSLNWFPSFSPLAGRFGVAALDLRGHGRGIPVEGRFRLSDCADDVAALVEELGTGPAILVGYSLGGVVAQMTWKRHPARVAGMVLCATSRNFSGTTREQLFYRGMSGAILALHAARPRRSPSEPALPPVRRELPTEPSPVGRRLPSWAFDELRRASPVAALDAMAALGRFSSHSWIGDVDVPAAVVVTTRDRLISPVRQRKLAAAIPGATVHEVDADHGACVLGADQFVPALVAACESVAARARRHAA